ncbi:MAG TPA: HdeD family acid-resistance protein [Edaphobacter sp.]
MSSPSAPLAAFANRSANWSIALSILLIVVGFLALVHPGVSGLGMTLFVGWLLIISGITHFVYAFKVHTAGRVLWEILLAIVYVVAGIYLIWHPLDGLVTLTLALVFYLFFEGIFELSLAFQLRPHPGWGWTLFDGIITILLGFLIWRHWPSSSVWAIGTLVGISMLFSGFSRLMLSMAAKRVLRPAV